jgi:hypothetical protein
MPLEGVRCISTLYPNREAREEAASLIAPSSGPTLAGTTPSLAFRAMVGPDEQAEMEVAL